MRPLIGGVVVLLGIGLNLTRAATVTAQLDADTVSVGEAVGYKLIFEGGAPQAAPEIKAPNLAIQFTGSSRFMQIINGQGVNQIILNYAVTPLVEGAHVIPAVTTLIGGRPVTSQPLQLRARKLDLTIINRQAFLKLTLAKTNVYVGETLMFDLDLYAIAEQQGAPEMEAKGFTPGKWLVPRGQIVNLGGQNFARYNFKSYVIPNQPGQLMLGPARFNVRLPAPNARRTLFGEILDWRTLVITNEPMAILVQALPATNIPPNFKGAVGSFSLSVSVTPTNVAVGDPITVKVEIAGNSVLDGLLLPEQPAWKEFKIYPPTGKVENADQLGLGGRKYFEQVVVPQNTEVRQLPPFQFSFFDPVARQYRTLASPAYSLIVRPSASAQPIALTEETNRVDIVHIKPQMGSVAVAQTPLLNRLWFLALQGTPAVVWLALLLRRRHLDRLASHPRLRRRQEVKKTIAAGLRELPKLAAPKTTPEFFAAVFRLLQERLGERLDLPASAITESVLEERLRPLGVAPELLKDLGELFQACNLARYAPRTNIKEFEDFTTKTKNVLTALEKIEFSGDKS